MVIGITTLLVCTLLCSNFYLYICWLEEKHQKALLLVNNQLLELKLQLLQQQLENKMLKMQAVPNSFDFNNYVPYVLGGVALVCIYFFLFSSRRDPFVGLGRELTNQNEKLAELSTTQTINSADARFGQFEEITRAITEEFKHNTGVTTGQFELLMTKISDQNATLAELILNQNSIGQRIIQGNTEIFSFQQRSSDLVFNNLDLILSLLRRSHDIDQNSVLDYSNVAELISNIRFG